MTRHTAHLALACILLTSCVDLEPEGSRSFEPDVVEVSTSWFRSEWLQTESAAVWSACVESPVEATLSLWVQDGRALVQLAQAHQLPGAHDCLVPEDGALFDVVLFEDTWYRVNVISDAVPIVTITF